MYCKLDGCGYCCITCRTQTECTFSGVSMCEYMDKYEYAEECEHFATEPTVKKAEMEKNKWYHKPEEGWDERIFPKEKCFIIGKFHNAEFPSLCKHWPNRPQFMKMYDHIMILDTSEIGEINL